MSRSSGTDFLIGVAVGTIIGAAAGILLAPKAGKDTRKIIKLKTQDAVNATKETAGKVKEKIASKVDKLKNSIEDSIDCAFADEGIVEEILEE